MLIATLSGDSNLDLESIQVLIRSFFVDAYYFQPVCLFLLFDSSASDLLLIVLLPLIVIN